MPIDKNTVHLIHSEMMEWYLSSDVLHESTPQLFSSISEDGEQLLMAVGDLKLNPVDRMDFLKTVIREERSVCYFYGVLMEELDKHTDTKQEILSLLSYSKNKFSTTNLKVNRSGKGKATFEHKSTIDSDDSAGIFNLFHDMENDPAAGHEKFKQMWASIRQKTKFINHSSKNN